MSDIARLFSESFNRTIAEMNERDKFEKQMAFQEKESAANEAFKQLQMRKMIEQAEATQAYQNRMEAKADEANSLARAKSARDSYVMLSKDDPFLKSSHLSGIDFETYKKEAGNMAYGDPNALYVDKDAYIRAYTKYAKESELAAVLSPLSIYNNLINNAPEAILHSKSMREEMVPIEQNGEASVNDNAYGMMGGFGVNPFAFGASANPTYKYEKKTFEQDTPYINQEWLNQFGTAYGQIQNASVKSPLAEQQKQMLQQIVAGQLGRLNTSPQRFVENADKWGYNLNPQAQALLLDLINTQTMQSLAQEAKQSQLRRQSLLDEHTALSNAKMLKDDPDLQNYFQQ